jgi:hypothetical protein
MDETDDLGVRQLRLQVLHGLSPERKRYSIIGATEEQLFQKPSEHCLHRWNSVATRYS